MWKGETFPLRRPEKYYYWCAADALLSNNFSNIKGKKSHNNQKLEYCISLSQHYFNVFKLSKILCQIVRDEKI